MTDEPFSARDSIAAVVAADPGAAGRLAALSPALAGLGDRRRSGPPGPGATLAEAAATAGVPLSDVLHAVNARSPRACTDRFRDAPEETPPPWMAGFDEAAAERLDIRELIAAGREPFTAVMTAAGRMAAGGTLVIDAPFNPLPLRDTLSHRAVQSHARQVGADHWRICCRRDPAATAPEMQVPAENHQPNVRETATGARVWQASDGTHIDVRHLQAPGPLVAILTLIDGPDHGGRVVVHHHRDPVYLFPELLERGWTWTHADGDPGEVRLILEAASESAAGARRGETTP